MHYQSAELNRSDAMTTALLVLAFLVLLRQLDRRGRAPRRLRRPDPVLAELNRTSAYRARAEHIRATGQFRRI